MALGVQGTGPYSKIRGLRQEIKEYKYELFLIASGMRRPIGKKSLIKMIAINRSMIKNILAEEKKK